MSVFLLSIYIGCGNIEYVNGLIKDDQSTLYSSNIAILRMGYEEFKELIYVHVGVDKIVYNLSISLCYEFGGIYNISRVIGDSSLDVMYCLAENNQNIECKFLLNLKKYLMNEQGCL